MGWEGPPGSKKVFPFLRSKRSSLQVTPFGSVQRQMGPSTRPCDPLARQAWSVSLQEPRSTGFPDAGDAPQFFTASFWQGSWERLIMSLTKTTASVVGWRQVFAVILTV
jgi:hypothetical protein